LLGQRHQQARLVGLLDPCAHVGGLRRAQNHRAAHTGELSHRLAHDLFERADLDFHVVLAHQLLRHDQVVARLRIARVGDGGRAHDEVALGLLELPGHRRLLRQDGAQVRAREQHVEVALRHPRNELLGGHRKLGLGLFDLHPRLLVGGVVLRPVQRLVDLHPVVVVVEVALRRDKCRVIEIRVQNVVVRARVEVDVRQQQRARLRQLLLYPDVLRLRPRVRRILHLRLPVDR
jgi:hypothetical protein